MATRASGVGVYFDMFSLDEQHWEMEWRFNAKYKPDFVELMLEVPRSTGRFGPAEQSRLRSIVGDTAFTVHGPTLNLSLCALNTGIVRASQDELLAGLDVCVGLGATLYTIHGGEYPFYVGTSGTSGVQEFVRNVRPLVERADEMGITVCVENLKNKHVCPQTFDELDEIFEAYPTMGLALDVRHLCINNLSPIAAWRRYRERVRTVQYRDDCGMTDVQLHDFIAAIVHEAYRVGFIVEDPALNIADKSDKGMLDKGLRRIRAVLGAAGGMEAT